MSGYTTPSSKARRLVRILVACVALILVGPTMSPATAAKKPKPIVNLALSGPATTGSPLNFTITVERGAANQKVSLERKSGRKWIKVANSQLPVGGTSSINFTLAPQALGTHVFRTSLKKKGKTRKAMSGPLTVVVMPPTPAPQGPTKNITLATSTSRVGSNTLVNFNGTLTGLPAGTQVTVEFSRGPNSPSRVWAPLKTVASVNSGSGVTYSGSGSVPIVIDASTQGAPRVNFRAVVGGTSLVSNVKAYLINTRFEGILTQFKNEEVVLEASIVVLYSDKKWYITTGNGQQWGTTDGWDLLTSDQVRLTTTFHANSAYCLEDPNNCAEPLPWIEAEWTSTDNEGDTHRISVIAEYDPD